jgi:succinoglycan biosynthesis protein ExoM
MKTRVSICLCTYRRRSVARTLASLASLVIPDGTEVELVVVDNDVAGSARSVCETAGRSLPFHLRYVVEPNRGLVHARNRALALATGDWLALIDDDEFAEPDWLQQLLTCVRCFHATIAIGTVVPEFEVPPPAWAMASRFFNDDMPRSGTLLDMGDSKSGNAMISAAFIRARRLRFDKDFSQTGGEDTEFFRRCLDRGAKIVSAPEAVVHELVPSSRMTHRYFLERSLRVGEVHARVTGRHAAGMAYVADVCRAVRNVVVAAALTVTFMPGGKTAYYRWYILLIRNVGKLRYYLGWAPLEMYK